MGNVHGYNVESGFGLGSFIQFGHDEIKTPAALGITVSAFHGVGLAGVAVDLSLNYLLGRISLSPYNRRSGEVNVMGSTESAVYAGLVNSVGQYRFGVTPEFASVETCRYFSLLDNTDNTFRPIISDAAVIYGKHNFVKQIEHTIASAGIVYFFQYIQLSQFFSCFICRLRFVYSLFTRSIVLTHETRQTHELRKCEHPSFQDYNIMLTYCKNSEKEGPQ